ncbi:hypothetical protein C8F04DRAFT_247379 [Mycena alexandri]|uniref:BAG domain-containing protein n=1 Tax=Mycena alexandri TaxID=1745969 RepID=A0AAD6S7Y0_9AGAR|nr:hypothetical protein C8F04DRAFT_247379 [Mycena alexandri]
MFSTQSYRSPVYAPVPTTTTVNPREKYLAALAEAKAAEAEYLAAERLQQEEDALRTRLEQIQALRAPQAQAPAYQHQAQYQSPFQQYPNQGPFAFIPDYPSPSPFVAPTHGQFGAQPDVVEQLRRQIAAEERARLVREQEEAQQARQREEAERVLRRKQEAFFAEAQRKQLERESRRAQRKNELERERVHSLAAQRARLEALTQRVLFPQAPAPAQAQAQGKSVRFALGEEGASCRQHQVRSSSIVVRSLWAPDHYIVPRQCRPHHAHARPEFHNTVDITPLLTATRHIQHQQAQPQPQQKSFKQEEIRLEDVFGHLFGERVQQRKQEKPKPAAEPQTQAIGLEQLLQHVFGAEQVKQATPAPQPKAAPKPQQPTAPQTHTVDLGELLQHVFGAQTEHVAQQTTTPTAAAPQPKAEQPAAAAPQAIDLGELLQHIFGGAEQQQPQAGPSGTKEATTSTSAPAAAESTPTPASTTKPATQPAPAPTPAPAAQTTQPANVLEHILNHFLGGGNDNASAPNHGQADLQQLMSMFLGPRGYPSPPQQPQASTSKVPEATSRSTPASSSPLKTELEARLRSQESSEERDLAEAIRMSLAEVQAAPATTTTTTSDKGKAPAPAPVKDVSTSAAEVASIDAAFTALADEFVFPAELDFGSSRAASPARSASSNDSASESQSPIARLSYSARNQPVRFYHQALSGLLSQLDAVDSFGDEAVRNARKEVVGRVEGALDEVEKVVEGRWRKIAKREERAEEAVVVNAGDAAEPAAVVVDAAPEPAAAPAEVESDPDAPAAVPEIVPETVVVAEAESTTPEPSSYPPSAPSSYPPSAAESVETLRPASASESTAPTSPTPSDTELDTFLLPATTDAAAKKPASKDADDAEADAGSDWSEVDA